MKEERIIENPKIYAAIAGVIADCGIVGKDKMNKQQGFKYRSVDDVFNALHPALAKNKVVIIPTVVERQCEEVGKTKNGTAILKVICKVKYDICAEDGSRVTSIIYGEGMDMGDKATNKATFTVTDGKSDSPKKYDGVRINVDGAILVTDSNGQAVFNLRAGNYTAKITKKGFVPVTETITVASSAVTKAVTLTAQA